MATTNGNQKYVQQTTILMTQVYKYEKRTGETRIKNQCASAITREYGTKDFKYRGHQNQA